MNRNRKAVFVLTKVLLFSCLFSASAFGEGPAADPNRIEMADYSIALPVGAEPDAGTDPESNSLAASGTLGDSTTYIVLIEESPESFSADGMGAENVCSTAFVMLDSAYTGFLSSGLGVSDTRIRDCGVTLLDGVPAVYAVSTFDMDTYTLGGSSVLPCLLYLCYTSDPAFVIEICYYDYVFTGTQEKAGSIARSGFPSTLKWKSDVSRQGSPSPEWPENALQEVCSKAEDLTVRNQYTDAEIFWEMLEMLGGYGNSEERLAECREQTGSVSSFRDLFDQAEELFAQGDYETAELLFRYCETVHEDGARDRRMDCLKEMGLPG